MRTESLLPIIVENYNHFTNVEKTIASYFLENKVIGDFSIKSLKDKLFVSEASLTRFAKKCGFRGYREFIYAYENEFIKISEDKSRNFEEVLNNYHFLLNQMINIVDEKQIEKLSKMINKAKYVQALGIGSSGFAAKEMKNRFARLGVLIEAIDKDDDMRMLSVFQKNDSLVIGISISGKKSPVLFSLKTANKNGAKTVLITSNKTDKYDYIDEIIIVPSLKDLDSGAIISPQFPILVIIDLLYNIFLSGEEYKIKRRELHSKTVQALYDKQNI